jgi:putative ABC transport system permease protein
MEFNGRIRAALRQAGPMPDDDVVEELAQHARALYDRARADGEAQAEARRRVDVQIALWAADATLLKRRPHRPAALEAPPPADASWTNGLLNDARFGLRLVRRRAGFTFLAVTTMALGIGVATTLFSVAHGELRRPLPWPDSDRLVVVKETRGGRAPHFGDVSNATYLAWRDGAATLDSLAAWSPRTVSLSGDGQAERISIAAVTGDMFRLLGARPLLGVLLEPADDAAARGPVVLLSEGLWRRRFGADPQVTGRAVEIDGVSHAIVGVLPDRQAYPDLTARAWVPLAIPPAGPASLTMLKAVAKLRPGVSIAQAASEGTARARTAPEPIEMLMSAMYGGTGEVSVSVTGFREARSAQVRPLLLVFMAAVGLMLVTAVANVAGLLLARGTTRVRELAIRAALGAGRPRLARQILVETAWLGLLGGAAGLILASGLHRLLPALLTPEYVQSRDVAVNVPVVAFAVLVAAVVGAAVGILPALRAGRLNLVESLADDGAAAVGTAGGSWAALARTTIITVQVAIACILLVGASLLVRSVAALSGADRGYDPSHVLSIWVPMPAPAFTPARRAEFAAGMVERLRAIPGVTAVAFTSASPLGSGGRAAFSLDGRTAEAETHVVTADYFEALGVRIHEGRPFTAQDAASQRRLLIVNRTFARRYLDGGGVGRQIQAGLFADSKSPVEVIAIVEDVRHRPERGDAEPQVYQLHAEEAGTLLWSGMTILARTDGDPAVLAGTVRALAREQDAAVALDSVMTMEERLRASMEGPRTIASLIGGFAGFALLIAAVGLFGTLSYSVAQRSRELAVRSALGARPAQLVGLVLRQGLGVVAAGVALGLGLASVLVQLIAAMLYGVTTRDPVTYVGVPVVLVGVALLATLVPALRAARIDPLRLLRGA